MLIEEKLAIGEMNKKSVCFIYGPLFCELFNESAYIVTKLLGFNLKIKAHEVKKLENKMVVKTGFPLQYLDAHFPKLVKTEWGFELKGKWNLAGYDEWFAEHVAQAACNADHPSKKAKRTAKDAKTPNQVGDVASMAARVYLTPQQVSFLTTWEREKYPVHVDIGFVESLKIHLLSESKN